MARASWAHGALAERPGERTFVVTSWKRSAPVWFCGVGAVTGYGWGAKLLWDGMCDGQSAVRLTPGFGSHFDVDEVYLAQVEEGGDPADGSSRYGRALNAAAREAIDDAMGRGWVPGSSVGLVHAFAVGEVDLWKDFYVERKGLLPRKKYMELMPSTAVSILMQERGFTGPCMGVSAMCASGNAAVLTAKLWLNAGLVTDVVVVTSDLSCNPENVRNFRDLGVGKVDTDGFETCRPFSKSSRGFNMGEASVAFVLSGQPAAGYARLLGGAMSNDAYHVVSIAPDHAQIKRCVGNALADAGVSALDIAYLNAHATGTKQCDAAEADLLDTVVTNAQAVATKPFTGHCQGAAAAVELAAACISYEFGKIAAPPAAPDAHPRLLDGNSWMKDGPTLKTALGMGGHNAAVVLAAP
jgi:3-oxoacyl-[acyl-carrier-protein] synthase II